MLGVGISDSQVDPKGAFVGTVQPGSPAAAAGIVPGDVITGVDGTPIAGAAELKQIVAGHAAGSALRLQVAHYGGAPTEIAVTLGGAPGGRSPTAPANEPDRCPRCGTKQAPPRPHLDPLHRSRRACLHHRLFLRAGACRAARGG